MTNIKSTLTQNIVGRGRLFKNVFHYCDYLLLITFKTLLFNNPHNKGEGVNNLFVVRGS